jgi:hypothetical protein
MSHIAKRREKRRSDLSALLGAASPSRRSSVSAPTSPSAHQPLLDVVEEDDTHPGASLPPRVRMLALELLLLIYAESITVRV